MTFKPHITVACLVSAGEKFLVVEETVNGKATWNQPAGHLEAGESLIAAAERELYEETGIRATPDSLLTIHQWVAPDGTPFIRFLFRVLLESECETHPQDSDIDCCHWVSADDIIHSPILRSPLVKESMFAWFAAEPLPLSLLGTFGDGFGEPVTP